jgi:hypothetical protein
MARFNSVKFQVENLLKEHNNDVDKVIHAVNECIYHLVSFTENKKITLTSHSNAHQIKFWSNVLIYINKNHVSTKVKLSADENKVLEDFKTNHRGDNPLYLNMISGKELRIVLKLHHHGYIEKGTCQNDGRLKIFYWDGLQSELSDDL